MNKTFHCDIFNKVSTSTNTFNPDGTRRLGDVPWKSHKGPKVQDFQGPAGNSWGANTKTDDLMKKVSLDAIVLVLHIYYCFLLEKQIFKSSKWRRPRDVYGTQLRDVLGRNDGTFWERPRDVGHTYFLNSTLKHINLLWQVTQDFIVNCSSEKFSEQCND